MFDRMEVIDFDWFRHFESPLKWLARWLAAAAGYLLTIMLRDTYFEATLVAVCDLLFVLRVYYSGVL